MALRRAVISRSGVSPVAIRGTRAGSIRFPGSGTTSSDTTAEPERPMENQRLMLWLAFTCVLFLLYQAWVQDHRPAAPPSEPIPAETPLPAPSELPAVPSASATSSATSSATPAPAAPAQATKQGGRIHVR